MPRATLSQKQNFQLLQLIEAEYTSSGKNDVEFAAYASEKIGAAINRDHIEQRRPVFDIPANKPRFVPRSDQTALFELIAAQEKRILALEKRLDVYFSVAK